MKQPLFGVRIAELRNKKGLTQKELAEACKVDIRTIQRIESGEVLPRMYTTRLLSKILGVEVTDFNDTVESGTIETNQPGRWPFIAAIIFSINYILVVYQIIGKSFGLYAHTLTILLHIVTCIVFFRGFYLLGKRSNNQVLSVSALLSMALLPLLNIMDLFKSYFFAWSNQSFVFTATCINAIIGGIGFLIESKSKTTGNVFYKIAGITTLVQSGLFLSQNFNLIYTGLLISMFCNVIMTLILYREMKGVGNQSWRVYNSAKG